MNENIILLDYVHDIFDLLSILMQTLKHFFQ